jgi:hypothetical protein
MSLVGEPWPQVFLQPSNPDALEALEAKKALKIRPDQNNAVESSHPRVNREVMTENTMLAAARFAMKGFHDVWSNLNSLDDSVARVRFVLCDQP